MDLAQQYSCQDSFSFSFPQWLSVNSIEKHWRGSKLQKQSGHLQSSLSSLTLSWNFKRVVTLQSYSVAMSYYWLFLLCQAAYWSFSTAATAKDSRSTPWPVIFASLWSDHSATMGVNLTVALSLPQSWLHCFSLCQSPIFAADFKKHTAMWSYDSTESLCFASLRFPRLSSKMPCHSP